MAVINVTSVKEFQKKLIFWYQRNGRKFPWRNKGLSSYKLIIAEVLLQRTKAETVKSFYHDFIKQFPSWMSLAHAEEKAIAQKLRPVGLYNQRAKRLKSLAEEMYKRNGKIPTDRNELESLPFLGQYITNAVELLILKRSSALIDVNMARVLERYFKERSKSDIRYDVDLQKLAFAVTDHELSKEINWAILDFAALICVARKPKCEMCILRSKCTFFKTLDFS